MGTRSRKDQPKGFQPNGLLMDMTTSVIRPIDSERLAKAEEKIAELISHIRPNWSSEKHRDSVARYVKYLITNCIPCQVFTFGSVPLKTYLPDGDIDLTVFSEDQNLKENWANEVRDMLEREERNEHAEFQVKEVQYIKAEVKIIKCLVDNIVVDISFNQLGGLCTLCFLEEVDNLISRNHLFKRSIILIKAWCYYESRILGAHHGLISTYALETLVLYTFHVFNNSFLGPLEVLYHFLEFFSKFDWANFCVSLWGPVPICSLPSMAADPPRKDVGELLLKKTFLSACSTAYSVFIAGQDTQGQPFTTKHFNVIDPLRINNNLGRSVNKGNFYRIRSAFSFGAQQLGTILDFHEENVEAAVNQFFVNTWDRHRKGCRPDASLLYVTHLGLVESKPDETSKKPTEHFITHIPEIDDHSPSEVSSVRNDLTKQQQIDTEKNCRKQNRGRSRHQFARTYSSPELTNLSSEALSQYTGNVLQGNIEKDTNFLYNCTLENRVMNRATDRTTFDPNHSSGIYVDSSEGDYSETRGKQKDIMSLTSPSGIQNYDGHVQLPVNLASHQLVQIPPSVLRYSHQIFTGSDWGTSMHCASGPPFPQQFNTVKADQLNDRAVRAEIDHQDDECGFWTQSYAVDSSKEIEDFSTATSLRTKASSECSWDGKPLKNTHGSKNSIVSVNNGWRDEEDCVFSDVDEGRKPGHGPVHMNYASPVLSYAPMIVRPSPQQGGTHNQGMVAFYPAGPPVPFVTMKPVYNVPAQTGTSNTENYHSFERNMSGENSGEGGSDIFNSDFPRHWKNLQYGRLCQISQLQRHVVCSPSVVVSPQHLQGDLSFNGPKKPSPRRANVFAQVGPVSAQVSSSKPAGVPRRYGGDVSRNRNGTGTYFPNPKILKDHQVSNPRQHQGDYNYDRNEQHGNREANWNFSKPRFVGRAQARYYNEKPNTNDSYGSSNEHFVGTNGRRRYWRRGEHQLQNYNADSGSSSPRFPGDDGF